MYQCKWLCGLWSLALLLAGMTGTLALERGVRPWPRIPSAFQREAPYRTSWALLIGINTYPPGVWSSLNYAVADLEAMYDLLVNHYGFPPENVLVLTDKQALSRLQKKVLSHLPKKVFSRLQEEGWPVIGEATKQNILDALTTVAGKCGKEDRVIVFFSGHGHTVKLPRGGERGYLVPTDVHLAEKELQEAARVEEECVPMTEIRLKALLIKARHVLFLIDACYSGLAISGRSPLRLPGKVPRAVRYPMLGIITAGRAGEEAFENPEWGHGAFTKALLDALTPTPEQFRADADGDGMVTLKELVSYLDSAVRRLTQDGQNPQSDQEGEGLFVYVPDVHLLQRGKQRLQDFADQLPRKVLREAQQIWERYFWGEKLSAQERRRWQLVVQLLDERVTPAEVAEVQARWTPTGILCVNAVPWAEVVLDGKPVGQTPLRLDEVSVGEHRLQLRWEEGYRTVERTVQIQAGEMTKVGVRLKKE